MLQFSDETNKNGIIQLIEDNLGFNDGDISGNTTKLAKFTGGVNLAVDEIMGFLFPKNGKWQLDDANHSKYPIITTDLISGQRDYTFTEDEDGNVILGIHKIMVADSGGLLRTIPTVDQQSTDTEMDSFNDGQDTGGTPVRYDKTANGIFLDPIPDYASTGGLKVFIDREASYFTTSDTTKSLGFAHLFHEYLALKPSYNYARAHGLKQKKDLKLDMLEMRLAIIEYFGTKDGDASERLIPNVESTR